MTEKSALPTYVVPVKQIRTSFSRLRSTVSQEQTNGLTQLPIRVVRCRTEPDYFELVDGFKRFRAACDAGFETIHAVVEDAADLKEAKRILLHANAPKRTLSPMDEARIVNSLVNDDGLTLTAASRFLGRKRSWASKRHTLATRLDASLQEEIDKKRLSLNLAYSLCRFDKKTQVRIAKSILQGGLSSNNGLALIATYCALDGKDEKNRLLHDPMGTLDEIAAKNKKATLPLSMTASGKLERYRMLKELLEEFKKDAIPENISPAEIRLLEAEKRVIKATIISCGQLFSGMVPEKVHTETTRQEETEHESRYDSRDLSFEKKRYEEKGDCEETGVEYKNNPAHPQKTPRNRRTSAFACTTTNRKAYSLLRHDQREGGERAFGETNPPGDQRSGVHGRTDHFDGLSP